MKQKIYIVGLYTGKNSYGVIQDAGEDGDILGFAMVGDNDNIETIATHYSSGFKWFKHDMGLTSDWKHDIYKSNFGDDYELIFGGTFNSKEELDNWVSKTFEFRKDKLEDSMFLCNSTKKVVDDLKDRLEEVESMYDYECECNSQFVACQNENEKLKEELKIFKEALELACGSIWEQTPPFCNFDKNCNDFSNDWEKGKCKECLIGYFREEAEKSLKGEGV